MVRAAVPATNRAASTTIEEMAEPVLLATDGDVIVVAHSMGGRVALENGSPGAASLACVGAGKCQYEGLGEHEVAYRKARIAEANADMMSYAQGWVPKVISVASMQKPELRLDNGARFAGYCWETTDRAASRPEP